MELQKLRPIVGNTHWSLLEDYLKEERMNHMNRLVAETDETSANILRGRIRELDTLIRLPSKVLNKIK